MRSSLFIAVALCGSTFVGAQSPTWIQSPINGHYYAVGSSTTSWPSGESLAASFGGHLATIRTAAEQAWIQATFAQSLGTAGLWIGFNDIAQEGQWVWSSGEPVTYTNWAPGQPDNGNSIAENAAHLWGSSGGASQWLWNDETESFASTLRPLIEVPPPFSPATYSVFGSGCALPSTPPPALVAFQGGVPRIGSTSRLRLSGLPVGIQVPVFVLGFSDTQNAGPLGAHALPFELSPLGFPGCWQYVSDDSTQFVLALNGYADWQITLPSNATLVGFPFFVQAAVPDALIGSVSLSNAVAAVIGY